LRRIITTMPHEYETEGDQDPTVWLHYFRGSADWHITERDSSAEQLQAFGRADLFGDGGELGYICIAELLAAGVEIDLHWTPKRLSEVARQSDYLREQARQSQQRNRALEADIAATYCGDPR